MEYQQGRSCMSIGKFAHPEHTRSLPRVLIPEESATRRKVDPDSSGEVPVSSS
jgi:hypothetical protein